MQILGGLLVILSTIGCWFDLVTFGEQIITIMLYYILLVLVERG